MSDDGWRRVTQIQKGGFYGVPHGYCVMSLVIDAMQTLERPACLECNGLGFLDG